MKRALHTLAILAAAAFATCAGAQSAPPSPPPSSPQPPTAATLPLRHESASFDLVVKASLAETEPLFGPEGERSWAGKSWNPEFFYPLSAHDEAGAVFKIEHGSFSAIWVVTQFDPEARHFQYAFLMQNLMVGTIDVRFEPIDARNTKVHVVYVRTAVSPEGNEHVLDMNKGDKAAGPKWQAAIDRYFAGRAQQTAH